MQKMHKFYHFLVIGIAVTISFTACKRNFSKVEINSSEQLFQVMKDKNDNKWFQHFTFKQVTLRYDTLGDLTDSTIWHEAVSYPGYFRIDRDTLEKNYVIFRNDSTYQFRSDTLFDATDKPSEHLVFKGGLYFMPIEKSIGKLKSWGYNLDSFRKENFNGQSVYSIGNDDHQFKLHATEYYCVYRAYTTNSGLKVEAHYDDFKKINGGWVEQKVTFYVKGKKRLLEHYFDIQSPKSLPTTIFNPNVKYEWYRDF